MEGTFLGFEEELEFSQALQDLRNVMAMVGHAPGVNQDVVDVDQYKFVEELPEHLMNEVLEYGGGVDQAVGHDQVFVVAGGCDEGGLPLVPLTYPDEVVRAAEVQLGEDSGTTEMFRGRWDERKGVPELDGDGVECPVIDTWPQASR